MREAFSKNNSYFDQNHTLKAFGNKIHPKKFYFS